MKTSYSEIYQQSISDPEGFWMQEAKRLPWFKAPEQALTTDENGFYRWFKGGKLNTCYLAVDQHVDNGRGDAVAIIYDSPVTHTIKKFTYKEVQDEVSCLAGGLQQLGLQKGDTVLVYMPMIPQAAFAMLACARLGAIHSVVFGGFAAHELAIRIDDAKPKLVITATSGIEIDRIIPYKPIVDEGINQAHHKPQHVVILDRRLGAVKPEKAYDIDYTALVTSAPHTACVEVDATDPLYILYTSGTTGKPKGIIRDNGGHAVALTYSMRTIYDTHQGQVFWAASDVGWVVGHSYIIYGPLMTGCATVLFEGKPIKTPDASTFWRVIAEHRVSTMFTAPTAIRAIKKEDPDGALLKQYDLSCLKYQFLAGERCDATTLQWLQTQLGVPVIDHWWQTESGWPMLANMMGIEQFPVKPGSATKPVCGFNLQVITEQGELCHPGEEGYVAIKLPLPPGCLPTLWGDNERFRKGYLEKFPGYYFSGDGGYIDTDGYFFITGRVDDIINVAGHRLSTAEMEEVVASHKAVAECCVVGIEDELKGQIPLALIVAKTGEEANLEQIEKEVVQLVRQQIGAVAALKMVVPVARLPKTRSGKILRKIIRAIADGKEFTVPSTIDDLDIIPEIEHTFAKFGVGVAHNGK